VFKNSNTFLNIQFRGNQPVDDFRLIGVKEAARIFRKLCRPMGYLRTMVLRYVILRTQRCHKVTETQAWPVPAETSGHKIMRQIMHFGNKREH